MVYTAIDGFYVNDEQLANSPSRVDGINEETETNLRFYGCDLIQESGILLRLPQEAMATAQVLFHRFYCKNSFAQFDVVRIAASCGFLASKLEERPRKAKQVLLVFHRMECKRRNLPERNSLDVFYKRYLELKPHLIDTELYLLSVVGFVCHVQHPHRFISNYLAVLGMTLPEMKQVAWNMANDSLRTTLCIRFKSEVVACGIVHAVARRFEVSLPENLPWWLVFDVDLSDIEEVCRVLAHLYSLPKAKYVSVCKDNDLFVYSDATLFKDTRLMAGTASLKGQVPEENAKHRNVLDAGEAKQATSIKPKGEFRPHANAKNSRKRGKELSKVRDHDSMKDFAHKSRDSKEMDMAKRS